MKNKNILQKIIIFLSFFLLCLNCSSIQSQAAKVKLNKKQATMWVGECLRLKVTGSGKKVTWSSSKKKIATVTNKGKVTAKKEGKAVITAKVSGKKYRCTITVKKIQLSAQSIKLKYGNSKPLILKGAKKKVAWLSSNRRVAYVENGTVFAKSVGQTTITAKCNGKEYKCNVTVTSGETEVMQENGVYTSKEKVALYIHTYKKLPSNFITKEQANALGWNGGSLLPYVPDKCIGGNIYTNYEKSLPTEVGRVYYECDINTLGALERGAERLVYSNDGLIYYTPDHYATFQQLY